MVVWCFTLCVSDIYSSVKKAKYTCIFFVCLCSGENPAGLGIEEAATPPPGIIISDLQKKRALSTKVLKIILAMFYRLLLGTPTLLYAMQSSPSQ